MGKIGARLQVHPASVTSAVKRLERDRFIRRDVSTADNRVVLAVLLPEGRRVLDRATTDVNAVFEDLGVDDALFDDLVGLLGPIRVMAGDNVESGPGD